MLQADNHNLVPREETYISVVLLDFGNAFSSVLNDVNDPTLRNEKPCIKTDQDWNNW